MLKISFGRLNSTLTPVLFILLYTRAALEWAKATTNVHLEMRNLKQTEIQRLKQRKERLRIRREKDRARRRTKKLQEEKKRSSETENHEKQLLATIRNIDHQSAFFILHYILIHYILIPYINCSNLISITNWRASKASETPSIATYRKKGCVYSTVRTSKPQCACSQFYVKRRSGCMCTYKKPACCSRVQLRKAHFTYVKMTKRMHIK